MVDKRERRTKAEILELRQAIAEIVYQQHRPLTVRYLFYLMVSGGLIPKTEDAYKNVTIRLAGQMREDWLQLDRLVNSLLLYDADDGADFDVEGGQHQIDLLIARGATIPFRQ